MAREVRRTLPGEVHFGVEHGFKAAASAVSLDHFYTVLQDELRLWLGHLDDRRMHKVCAAAAIAIGCT